jgi:Domain of unknown function (DUF4041)/Meiotically up-regulated gene 113
VSPSGYSFNAPPGWQVPKGDWAPPEAWTPDPSWPEAPRDWEFWIATPVPSAPAPPVGHTNWGSEPSSRPLQCPTHSPATRPPNVGSEDALKRRITELEGEVARLKADGPGGETIELDDERVLQDVGIYRYHHPLENAAEYKDQLSDLSELVKAMVKAGHAVLASDLFTFNNSLAKGRRMTSEFSKLMLRAYNAEADNCVRALRAGNVLTAKKRLESSVTTIARLGAMMEMRVNPEYHALRVRELELTADYLMKLQVEKEEAREERERLREERKAEQELAAERARLDKEREHYANALHALAASADDAAIADLNERLHEIDEAIAHNDLRTANIRAGYVYVISNRGALGPNIVKIGLTRRLEPMDRVRELGDASVPFPFDVHAMFFAEDAVAVEADLHRAFAERRVNHVNQRREFFFASPAEVRTVLLKQVGNLLEFAEHPEATQYLQSMKYWPVDAIDNT